MKTWLSLLAICILLGGLLSGTHRLTKPTIEANRSAAERALLVAEVAPQGLPERLSWQGGYLPICEQLTLESLTTPGYGGPMTLLISYHREPCNPDQSQCQQPSLRSLKVSQHAETPGIGDFFETTRPQWLQQLEGVQLSQAQTPTLPQLDAVSGATITANALRNGVLAALTVGSAIPFTAEPCDPGYPPSKGDA